MQPAYLDVCLLSPIVLGVSNVEVSGRPNTKNDRGAGFSNFTRHNKPKKFIRNEGTFLLLGGRLGWG